MKLHLLRILLVLDAAVLLALSLVLMAMPGLAMRLFHMGAAPPGVTYVIGILGCVFGSLGIGHLIAAQDPVRHVAWIQVAMVRGLLECLFGIFCVLQGVASSQQAGFGMAAGAIVLVSYGLLYPRTEVSR